MQHIPLLQNPTIGYIEVPCLTNQEYDGGDLETFPARQGYGDRTALEWNKLFEDPSAEFVAFLQLWQYFGYISTVLRFATLANLTKVTTDGRRVVDTSSLIALTEEHIGSTPEGYELEDEGVVPSMRPFPEVFDELDWDPDRNVSLNIPMNEREDRRLEVEVISLYTFMSTFEFHDPLPLEILDSIRLLRDFVFVVCMNYSSPFSLQKWRQLDLNNPGDEGSSLALACNGGVYKQRMLDQNWCPSRIQEYTTKLTLTAMVHVANLPRPDDLNHHNCTTTTCCHARVDEATYSTRHATDCSGCPSVAADFKRMSLILESDSYPVVDLFAPIMPGDKLCLSSVDSRSRTSPIPYVAISHVWSDGLGNPRENSIPSCQLSNLRRLVRNVPQPPDLGPYSCFWLDTICCPVEDGSEAQKMAIARMKTTYENASAVLVLDASLVVHTAKTLSDVEILLRIVCSKWMGRLWTLQEGALARKLFFQFADGPYDVDLGVSRLMASQDPAVRLTMQRTIIHQVEELRVPVQCSDQADALKTLANAVRFRSTSVHSDEPLCLANLLRINSSTIWQIPASDQTGRMMAFWKLISKLPLLLIFENREKLSQPGFQWAPKSLLQWQAPTMASSKNVIWNRSAERTHNGLQFRAPGIVVSPRLKSKVPASFVLCTTKGRWISVGNFGGLDVCDSGSGPLMLVGITDFEESAVTGLPGLLVEELGSSFYGQHRARIIQYVSVRMFAGQDDGFLVDSAAYAATFATVVSMEAAELGWKHWLLQ